MGKESLLQIEDLKNADEAFFPGTAAKITPKPQIDDTPCKEITREIQEQFLRIIRGK